MLLVLPRYLYDRRALRTLTEPRTLCMCLAHSTQWRMFPDCDNMHLCTDYGYFYKEIPHPWNSFFTTELSNIMRLATTPGTLAAVQCSMYVGDSSSSQSNSALPAPPSLDIVFAKRLHALHSSLVPSIVPSDMKIREIEPCNWPIKLQNFIELWSNAWIIKV